jgi:hypothetical protein
MSLVALLASSAAADRLNGSDREAAGSLLDDGSGATASAGFTNTDTGESHGSRRPGSVVCLYYYDATGDPVDFSDVQPYPVYRDCTDRETGDYVSSDVIMLEPTNPAALATEARTVAQRT